MASELTGGSTVGGERIETTAGSQVKANVAASAAQNAAIAWAQSYGLGSTATTFPTGDLNNIVAPSGLYNSSALVNAPIGDPGWFFIIHMRHANATGYLSQIAVPFARSAMYTRSCNGGTWSPWVETVDEKCNTAATVPNGGGPGVYGTITWNRVLNGTKHMVSVASAPDANGYPTSIALTYYNMAGTVVVSTENWTISYDVNGVPINKTKV